MTPGEALNIVEVLNRSKDRVKSSKLLDSLNFVFPKYLWYWSKNTIQVSGSRILRAKDFGFINKLAKDLDNFHVGSSIKEIQEYLNLYQDALDGLEELINNLSTYFLPEAHLYLSIDKFEKDPLLVITVRQKVYAPNIMEQIEKADELYTYAYLEGKPEVDFLLTTDFQGVSDEHE